MTDYRELVKQLRQATHGFVHHEAADAIEEQAKEIAAKDARIAELEVAFREAIKEVSRCSRECWKYEARIAELEATSKAYADVRKPEPR